MPVSFVEAEGIYALCTCTVTCECGMGSSHFVGGDGIGTMHVLWKDGRRGYRHYARAMEGERIGTMHVLGDL